MTPEGTVAFKLQNPSSPTWTSDWQAYDFPLISQGDVTVACKKASNRRMTIDFEGDRGSCQFVEKMPANATPAELHVAITWKDDVATLFLNSARVASQQLAKATPVLH